jgi:DNA-binding CsgD family transcriptional regulator
VDDVIESIAEIYDAIGDADRWQRLRARLAAGGGLAPVMQEHIDLATRAHERHLRLTQAIGATEGVHSQLGVGVALVDRDGRLLRANDVANHLLAGDALQLVNGRVDAGDSGENAILHDAIARASDGVRGGTPRCGPFIQVSRRGRLPLCIVVLHTSKSIPTAFENPPPIPLLLIDPALLSEPGTGILRGLFGFTAREAEFARLLMVGASVTDAAQSLGVALSTARTYLAHVTQKTDTHSQAELVGRLLAIPPARLRE